MVTIGAEFLAAPPAKKSYCIGIMTPDHAPEHPLPNNTVAKKQTLLLFLALMFVEGWFYFLLGEGSNFLPLYWVFYVVANTVFIVRWVALDAAERRFKLSKGLILFFVLSWLLALPFYFLKTRGVEAWRPILLTLPFFVTASFCFGLGAAIAEHLKI